MAGSVHIGWYIKCFACLCPAWFYVVCAQATGYIPLCAGTLQWSHTALRPQNRDPMTTMLTVFQNQICTFGLLLFFCFRSCKIHSIGHTYNCTRTGRRLSTVRSMRFDRDGKYFLCFNCFFASWKSVVSSLRGLPQRIEKNITSLLHQIHASVAWPVF